MTVTDQTRKALWSRAHDRCAFPGCLQALTVDVVDSSTGQARISVVGEQAHIRSRQENGPRYDPAYPTDKLDEYENLVLLCPTHHSLIDDRGGAGFAVGVLVEMKQTHERQQDRRAELEDLVRSYVSVQYDADDKVYFQQVDLHGPSVDSMFVDVPIGSRPDAPVAELLRKIANEHPGDSEATEEASDLVVTGAAQALLHPQWVGNAILVGGPGQGKSTLLQYVCQFHRARRLGKDTYSADETTLVRSTSTRRFPIRLDLRKYARWASSSTQQAGTARKRGKQKRKGSDGTTWPTIEQYVSFEVQHSGDGRPFDIKDLAVLIATEPVLIALDGLDEVADLKHREQVTIEIAKMQARMSANAADSVILVATRPGGTLSALSSSNSFPVLYLRRLSQGLRLQYLQRWAKVAGLSADQTSKLQTTFMDNQHVPHIKELASYPMQLAILLHLLHRRQLLPQQRTELYREYLKTFLDREQSDAKEPLLTEERQVIVDIHAFLAWYLQTKAEQGLSSGSIEREELRALVHNHLAGREDGQKLAERLFSAISTRVLCLVERDTGSFQFEVQSLREYFAAFYIFENAPVRGARNSRDDCLNALLERPYWSNVCRFFVGMFSQAEVRGMHENLQRTSKSVNPHPMIRSMSALFLDDRTYEGQTDAPIRAAVDFILDGPGVVYAEDGLLNTTGTALVLGERAGRAQAVQHLKERLSVEPSAVMRRIVAFSLQRHSVPTDTLVDWWWASFESDEGWLETASDLRVLAGLDAVRTTQLAAALAAGASPDYWRSALLLNGGYDGSSEDVMVVVRDELNDGAGPALENLRSRTGVSRLIEAAAFAEGRTNATSGSRASEEHTSHRTRLRGRDDSGTLSKIVTASNQLAELHNSTTDISRISARLSVIGEAWGDGWVLRSAVAAIPTNVDLGAMASTLDGEDATIAATLRREADQRSNRGKTDWWAAQYSTAANSLDQRSWLFGLLAHASPPVVVTLAEQMDLVTVGLAPKHFGGLAATLRAGAQARRIRELAMQEPLRLNQITVSARSLWLIRAVATESAAERISKRLDDKFGDLLTAGMIDSREILREIHPTRVIPLATFDGARNAIPPGGWASDVKLQALNNKSANEVLAEPVKWPTDIVQRALDRSTAIVSAKTPPLAELAIADHWFEVN